MIPFNKPYLTGKESAYIEEAVSSGKISGNGSFTQKCQQFFESKYGFNKCLLTTSCTDALEMAAILCNIQPGDEVIIPGYTFVSSALAFVRQGGKVIFADSHETHPNIDPGKIESLITPSTKAIVIVHYSGIACNMDMIEELALKYNLIVVEDAAHSIDSYFTSPNTGKRRALGSIGSFGCFSFHETKNIISGEGGMLAINDANYIPRSEIIWEKGTNRAEFFRGEVNKYGWKDIGSSFLPSEITAAFLWAQIENLEKIQARRKQIWELYFEKLTPLSEKGYFSLPSIPAFASNNAHIFYLLINSLEERSQLISFLRSNGILAVFHYLGLHNSDFYKEKHDNRILKNCDHFSDCLIRLPLFYELSDKEVLYICQKISKFFE